ncbi:MAG TPA: zinc carboxypeptidase [Firmicutes bacterium]|jgi:hypothetical protein|nr:zinc carboxypeptidase [Candidatus Fermentithermobacillaceae bacterium]
MKSSYERLVKSVPDYKVFLTVDEMDESTRQLATEHPDCVKVFEAGRSRENHSILCLKIGDGPQNALIFGCPHPNEPIGSMLLEHFARSLAEDPELRKDLGFTWYIIKCWDVDGAKLNENWFKGPFTLRNYIGNIYRPAGFEQVDWTFPVDYKELHFHDVLPETKAMMNLIDDVKPRFIYSLHNAGFGGVYWYMSAPTTDIFEDLRKVPVKYKVPVHLGEPESPAAPVFYPAIYGCLGIESAYDHMEKYGRNMKEYAKTMRTGNNSAAYARSRHGSFTLLTELPYFYDPRIEDQSPSDMLRKDAVIQKIEEGARISKGIIDILEMSKAYMDPGNHFKLAVEAFNSDRGSRQAMLKMASENPEYARPATGAEKFDNLLVSKFYRAISCGMLVRANASELAEMDESGEQNVEKREALETALGRAKELFDEVVGDLEAKMNYQVVPIKKLVSIQLECGLMVAEYLKAHPEV